MTAGLGLSEAGQGVAAAVLLALGAALKWAIEWLSGQRGSRMNKLEKKVDRLNAKVVMIGGALAQAVAELRHTAPQSASLAHYDRVLRIAFPVARGVPEDLAALMAQLDGED